ncbi:hypothetical protein [Kribbella catacumbae]|uniref:hypothetical protein n=1 Tax=Kribbella catacumbae TaxID=460086 RepID=UPI0003604C8B|nr:hypothetical protein [Kribbella catacumbae]
MHTNTIGVELQHSSGHWVAGLLDCDTVHSRYPSVLFKAGGVTDEWTEIHEDRVRPMEQRS